MKNTEANIMKPGGLRIETAMRTGNNANTLNDQNNSRPAIIEENHSSNFDSSIIRDDESENESGGGSSGDNRWDDAELDLSGEDMFVYFPDDDDNSQLP